MAFWNRRKNKDAEQNDPSQAETTPTPAQQIRALRDNMLEKAVELVQDSGKDLNTVVRRCADVCFDAFVHFGDWLFQDTVAMHARLLSFIRGFDEQMIVMTYRTKVRALQQKYFDLVRETLLGLRDERSTNRERRARLLEERERVGHELGEQAIKLAGDPNAVIEEVYVGNDEDEEQKFKDNKVYARNGEYLLIAVSLVLEYLALYGPTREKLGATFAFGISGITSFSFIFSGILAGWSLKEVVAFRSRMNAFKDVGRKQWKSKPLPLKPGVLVAAVASILLFGAVIGGVVYLRRMFGFDQTAMFATWGQVVVALLIAVLHFIRHQPFPAQEVQRWLGIAGQHREADKKYLGVKDRDEAEELARIKTRYEAELQAASDDATRDAERYYGDRQTYLLYCQWFDALKTEAAGLYEDMINSAIEGLDNPELTSDQEQRIAQHLSSRFKAYEVPASEYEEILGANPSVVLPVDEAESFDAILKRARDDIGEEPAQPEEPAVKVSALTRRASLIESIIRQRKGGRP